MRYRRPLVGVAVDAAMGHGRGILRGVMRYANMQRRWLLHQDLRALPNDPDEWPACDGAITAAWGGPLAEHILANSRYAVACTGNADPAILPVVRSDDLAIGVLAAEHLMDCRIQHFGYYGRQGLPVSDDRAAGFSQALGNRGFVCSTSPVHWPSAYGWTNRPHWPALIEWLKEVPKPVGILAMDDTGAHDLAAACLEAGLSVPDRVAIIGVNNDDLLCDSAWPPLSSVATEPSRLGFEAARTLDRLLAGESLTDAERVTRISPVGVVRRVSTDVLAVSEPNLAEAVRFIRDHACDPCSVGDVLRHVPVGRRWLERQFVQNLGRTPLEEITRVRIEAARRLLLQTENRIPDIALRCGFGTVQAFGHAFHQTTKLTPAAWRRAQGGTHSASGGPSA